MLNTQGLGGDPYESAILRIEKNRCTATIWCGARRFFRSRPHRLRSANISSIRSRTLQDHDLTLFPQSHFKLFLGYSRNVDDGPALSTVQLFNSTGDVYPVFANIHDQQNEYRLGGEANFFGFRLNVMHGWVDYKEDTLTDIMAPEPGMLATLTSFASTQPYHGTSPYWRAALFREGKHLWALNGRFSYVSNHRGFIDNELATL